MNTNDNTIYREAVGYLSSRITGNPETAIILGFSFPEYSLQFYRKI